MFYKAVQINGRVRATITVPADISKEVGVYMYIYTGGEPLVRKKGSDPSLERET